MKKVYYRTNPTIYDYIGVILLLFVSRSVMFWAQYGASLSYTLFLVYSVFLFLVNKGRIRNYNSVIYAVIFSLAIILNRFAFNTSTTGQMWLANISTCVGSLFFFSSFSILKFKRCYLNVMAVLMAVAIPLHLIDLTVGLPGAVTVYNSAYNSDRIFLVFSLGSRLKAIWGEPGVAQIFINTAFVLFLPELRDRSLKKHDWIKMLILLLALILGMSTAGYIVFAVILISLYYSSRKVLTSFKKFVLFPFLIASLYVLAFSPTVQDKFAQDKDAYTSLGNRYRDNVACLTMAIDRPFTGYGFGTSDFSTASDRHDNLTSSNGVLAMAARIGLWWIFLYIPFLVLCIRKLDEKIPVLLILSIILMMEFNEDFIEFPISYLFLMNFGSYALIRR